MQYRHWLLAGVLAQAGIAQAMGLGEMELHSHLGAPLQAELNLFSTGQYDQQEIQVRIARLEVYDRLGARFDAFHSQIEFSVRRDAAGQIQILATTRKRVTEPFLDFVVELSWPGGTRYRRYNVLVDPPEYALRWQTVPYKPKATPVEPAAVQLARRVAPVPQTHTATPPPTGDAYVVRSGDSLWKIARQLSGDGKQSVHAVMQSLYAMNPAAFVQGDRNRLKLGATLQVPAPLEFTPVQQMAQLNQAAPPHLADSNVLAVPSAPAPAQRSTAAAPAVDIQAELASASDAQHAAIPEDIAGLKAAIARLEQEKRELQQFQQQLKTEMTGVLEQRIAVTQAQLQAEQQQRQWADRAAPTYSGAVERADNAEMPRAEATFHAAEPEPAIAAAAAETAAPTRASLSDMRLRDLMAVTEAPGAVPVDMTMAVAAQDLLGPAPSFSNRVISSSGTSLWYLLAMVPLGMLLVLMGMRSHRVQQLRRTDQVKDENLHERVFGSRRDRSRSESPDQLQQALSQIREKADSHGKQRQQQQASEALEARDDLKQMIELYLLYSQYQKALNVILTEITKRPGRADLRLYLMRVYAEMGDWKAFEEQEEVLRRLGQQQLLEQASQLRSQKHPH